MSIDPLTSTLNFDGVISGLHTGDIIDKMMSLESVQVTRLAQKKAGIQQQDTAYRDIRTSVSSLQTALAALLQQSAVLGKTTTTDTQGILTVTASSDAAAGAFQVWVDRLATATAVTSGGLGTEAAIGQAVDDGSVTGAVLTSAGLGLALTSGTFTINGVQVTIDAATDRLSDVITRINTTAGTNVTASLVADEYGRANKLQLVATNGQPIQLGASGDSSNFLQAARLVASGGTTVTTQGLLGTVGASTALASARLAFGGSIGASGSFTVNGISIDWNSSDSLNTVLNRVNAAGAGVQAAYDSLTDRVTLTSTSTGNSAITLTETSGSLLQALGLVDPAATGPNQAVAESYGQTAQYSIGNHAIARYSNSNTVANALPGVTLNLLTAQASGADPVTVTVSQDVSGAERTMKAFVDAFNATIDKIQDATAYNTTTKTGSTLTGDIRIQALGLRLRELASNSALGSSGKYRTLADIGVSTGAWGSAVGTTDHLTLDEAKFTSALQDNAQSVFAVLGGLTSTTVLNPSGGGTAQPGNWLASVSGAPSNQIYSGTYSLTFNGTDSASATFTLTGGSTPLTTVVKPMAPGTVDGSLIPGMTLTAQDPVTNPGLPDTIVYTVSQRGMLQDFNAYLDQVLGTGGLFDAAQSGTTSELAAIDKQVDAMQERLNLHRATLQRQFTAMETALAQLNAQGGMLFAKLGMAQQ